MSTRLAALVMAVVFCSSPLLAWNFEQQVTVEMTFVSSPPGAQVLELTGDGAHLLGVAGQALPVHIPATRDEHLTFRVHLAGYRDETLEMDSVDLRQQRQTTIPVTLLPSSPWVPVGLWMQAHAAWLEGLVALVALLAAAMGWSRRRMQRQLTALDTLIPQEARRADPNVGQELGGYLLLRQLGKGGAATVYTGVRADEAGSGARVAVKLLNRASITSEFKARFKREVTICKSLNHANLVRLIDWGDGEYFYLVMELVEGHPLRRYIGARGMAVDEAMGVLQGVFPGVSYAHGQGIVHCDLKPENIMVTSQGQVRVMDFGIATGTSFERLTRTRDVMGTPGFMAPEQLDGVRNDPRSDQYALGAIVFEMLTGRSVFEEADPMARITRHLAEEPPRMSSIRPAIAEGMSDVVARLLAKKPGQRYPSVQAAWEALTEAAGLGRFPLQQKTMWIPVVSGIEEEAPTVPLSNEDLTDLYSGGKTIPVDVHGPRGYHGKEEDVP